MPAATLILPGFFGKLPSMGDFVTRGLATPFVTAWDRWISRHLAPRFSDGDLDGRPVLRFILGADAWGPMAGVIVASTDRSGRRFPLTVAAAPPVTTLPLFANAGAWFEALTAGALYARDAGLDADELATGLAAFPFPDLDQPDPPHRSMAISLQDASPVIIDPAAPGPMLDRIFLAGMEAGRCMS